MGQSTESQEIQSLQLAVSVLNSEIAGLKAKVDELEGRLSISGEELEKITSGVISAGAVKIIGNNVDFDGEITK